jgi:2'-5' RNA ligase
MPRRDIGVAIGLPEPYHAQLQRARERFGDPNAAQIAPHVTLLPPTRVATSALDEVEEHLAKVACDGEPFTIHLTGAGTFRPVSPVVFVEVRQGADECAQLAGAVRSGPLAREVAFPFHPHVTVAHDLPAEALDAAFAGVAEYDARFEVWGFTLFERGPDAVWRPQRDFAFGSGLPGPAHLPQG